MDKKESKKWAEFQKYYQRMLVAEECVAELEGKFRNFENLSEGQHCYAEWFAKRCIDLIRSKVDKTATMLRGRCTISCGKS